MRTKLTLNRLNLDASKKIEKNKRIEDSLANNFPKDNYILKMQENIIIVNKKDQVDKVIELIKEIEPNIIIKKEEIKEKYRFVFYLKNLDCANCAIKIERIVRRSIPNELVVVDFATLKIVIETTNEYEAFDLRMLIQEYAETVDPQIEVKEKLQEIQEEKDFRIEPKKKMKFIIGISIFIVFYIAKNIIKFILDIDDYWVSLMIYAGYIPAYYLLAKDVLYGAFKNIKSGRVFDEKFLMALATVMALLSGLYDEALFVIIFYTIGEMCQQYAVNYSRKSIASLVNIKPVAATIEIDGRKQTVSPEGVVIGDILYINSGEKIALDGEVIDGNATLDVQALTGESKPIDVTSGSSVLSGSICLNGTIRVKVVKSLEESMVSKIIEVASNASTLKAKSEDFISKFAKYYTPIIVVLAIIIAIVLPLFGSNYELAWKGGFQDSLRVSMIFLVVSCPCALVISIPLGFFGGIGACSRQGILVKGSNYLESLNNVGVVVFDKTGTLTKGNFALKKIVCLEGYKEDEVLHYAAYAEATSSHVISKGIINAYGKAIDTTVVENELIEDKRGIKALVENRKVAIGRKAFIENIGIDVPQEVLNDILIVCLDEKIAGFIYMEDEIRDEAKEVISNLKKQGIQKIIMLTGDSYSVSEKVSKELGIDEFYHDATPIDKVDILQKIKNKYSHKKIAFIGDGINDAPVIGISDVGFAMGGFGSEAATQIADVVLLNDDLHKINTSINIARKTREVVVQNIILALVIKLLFLVISPLNINAFVNTILVYAAIFADVGVSLIAILNTLKILKVKK